MVQRPAELIDNRPGFPDVYAQSGKWFRRRAKSFRRRG